MTMPDDKMERFGFLLGTWNLEYRVPRSTFSEPATGTGTGTFRRALNDKYVYFDYSCSLTTGDAAAHAVFAWDEKAHLYRYWWFEDSGCFLTATCDFVDDDTLCLNWHDSLLVQRFTKTGPDKIILQMEHPSAQGLYDLTLEVMLVRA